VTFDIEEAITYFESVFDLRYLEREEESSKEKGEFSLTDSRMRVYGRKELLDRLVDYLDERSREMLVEGG
jgi:hypothetical protein